MLRAISLRLAERRRYDYWRMERWEFDVHQANEDIKRWYDERGVRKSFGVPEAEDRSGEKRDAARDAFAKYGKDQGINDLSPYNVGMEMTLFLDGLIFRPVETFFANLANGRFFSFPDRLIRLYELGFEHRFHPQSMDEYVWFRDDCFRHVYHIKRIVVKMAYMLHGQNAPPREEGVWMRTDDRGWEHLPTEHVQVAAPLADESGQNGSADPLQQIRRDNKDMEPFSEQEQQLMKDRGYVFRPGEWACVSDTAEEAEMRKQWVRDGKYNPDGGWAKTKDENKPKAARGGGLSGADRVAEAADGPLPRYGTLARHLAEKKAGVASSRYYASVYNWREGKFDERDDDKLIPVDPENGEGPTFQSPPLEMADQRHCAGRTRRTGGGFRIGTSSQRPSTSGQT